MTARSLVLGFDGFDLGLVEKLGPEKLPTLHKLMHQGAYAALQSVEPPATLPNWSTFLTGMDPGEHGVFDFTMREGYGVRFVAGSVREQPTIFSRLDQLGLRCACLGFPATWPPEELEHGIFMSGWDSPLAFEANRSFVWPPSLYDSIHERFGPLRFDTIDECNANDSKWLEALPGKLIERVEEKAELAAWLLSKDSWDVFAFYFGESDTAAHYLWAAHDPESPRHLSETGARARQGLSQVYSCLDRTLGRLWELAGGDEVELTIVSDHGSGGSSDKVLYLNRALEEAGLLHFHKHKFSSTALNTAKRLALTNTPRRLKDTLFRFQNAALPSWLESNARFGKIDKKKTLAFSDELNYFPAIHLNIRGREPQGILAPEDVPETIERVRASLLALRDPWTKEAVVRRVYTREELYRGPYTSRAPDLILELNLDGEYSYNLMPSASAPSGSGSWRRLHSTEYAGKKGRSLPGAHRKQGFMLLSGPRIQKTGEIEAKIGDATATLLARKDIAVPATFCGRVLWETMRTQEHSGARLLPKGSNKYKDVQGDYSRIEERLRALGYLD